MTENDVIVTMKHVRIARMCSGGAREFFKRHNLDWYDFLKNGIPASKLEELGDGVGLECVKVARNVEK